MNNLVVGKRVTIGAAILSVSEALQIVLPDHAAVIGASTIAVTFVAQVLIAHYFGVTVKK